jgi:hypothetical protein
MTCDPLNARELEGSNVQCETLVVRSCLTVNGVEITGGGGGGGEWTKTGTDIAPTVLTDTVSVPSTLTVGELVIDGGPVTQDASETITGAISLATWTNFAQINANPGTGISAQLQVGHGNISLSADGSAGNNASIGLSVANPQPGDGIGIQTLGGAYIGIDAQGAQLNLGTVATILQFFAATIGAAGGSPLQTITGSRGGNAALASLLTALQSYGLVIDGTTP